MKAVIRTTAAACDAPSPQSATSCMALARCSTGVLLNMQTAVGLGRIWTASDLTGGAELVGAAELVTGRLLLREVKKAVVCAVCCGVQLRGVSACELCVFRPECASLCGWITPKAVTRHRQLDTVSRRPCTCFLTELQTAWQVVAEAVLGWPCSISQTATVGCWRTRAAGGRGHMNSSGANKLPSCHMLARCYAIENCKSCKYVKLEQWAVHTLVTCNNLAEELPQDDQRRRLNVPQEEYNEFPALWHSAAASDAQHSSCAAG